MMYRGHLDIPIHRPSSIT